MRSILCHPMKEKGHRVQETVVSSAVEHIFNVIALHAKARTNRASHGPSVRATERVKKVRDITGKCKGATKGSYKGKTSKTGLSGN